MRCKRLTAIAWLIIIASGLASIISLFVFANWLVGGYGSQSGSFFEWVSMVLGPPVTFVAAIGLLRRWRWARFYMITLLFVIVAMLAKDLRILPPSGPTTTVGSDGVPMTTFHSGSSDALPTLAVSIALLAVLFSAKVRAVFAAPAAPVEEQKIPQITLTRGDYDAVVEREIDRGWRVGHHGRDLMFYEESHGRDWRGIQIDGEMLTGRAHHVIRFASAGSWHSYPEWAWHRRDQIIARIKSEFPEPDYKYADGGTARATPPPLPPAPAKAMTGSELHALLGYLAILLGITVLMAWLATTGLQREESYWPSKHHTPHRMISRKREPVLYWAITVIYSGIGLGTLGLSACLVHWSRPHRGKSRIKPPIMMKTTFETLSGRKRILIAITRDSVCAGDDCGAPHETSLEIDSFLDPAAFAQTVSSVYLPSVAGVGHKWTCLLNGTRIAEIGNFGISPLLSTTPFADANRVHFIYHSSIH